MVDSFLVPLLKIVIVLNATLVGVTYMVLLERKVIAWAQSRLGPMRVGPYGILQPVADAVKLMIKEDITPVRADKWVFTAAPIIAMVPALIVYAVIPFGPEVSLFGRQVTLYITDINVGLLYIVSVASVGVYGIILAGYASNSKFPLLASLRASAQLISYEVAVTLTLVSVILVAGSLSMVSIVRAQESMGVWFAFLQPVAFVLFFIGGLAETNRAPFDLPEAEQELTGGFHTEYSGMRFALFFLAEYANMIVVSSVATTLVPRRVAAAVSERRVAVVPRHHPELGLVPPQVVRLPLHLHLGAGDAAALSVRPADAPRLEGADPAGDSEPGGHRDRESDAALMGEAIAFYTIAAFVLGFAVLVVSTKDTVHSVLFLVLDFLFVAALYVLLGAEFLAAIQVLVYAGGIVVLYLFVVMLVNLKRPPETYQDPNRRGKLGFALSAAVLIELGAIAAYGYVAPSPALAPPAAALPVTGNTEEVGWLLYTSYLIPFEIASMLLLVAMIGAIILAKREL